MSTHAYSEDQLVEQPAIGLFAALGWQTMSALEESVGTGATLGRETKSEVVLVERLRAALCQFNCKLPPEAIQTAIDELTRDRSAMSLEAANREVYRLLKEGITVSIPDREHGGQKTERLRVVDWEHPENNDFLLVSQFSVTGALYTCRPDLVGFVNGLPWVVIELKKPGVPARAAFDENLTHYKQQIPALFWSNALLIASNGTDSRVGSLTADWGRWVEWKRIEREDEPRRVSMEVMLRGTCDPTRLLDLVENFTLFSEHKAGLVKILGQNHQYLGVNNAIASMLEARQMGHGRGGVFWQTQGSGKSFSMVFFAQKVLRKLAGNWTFVVVTDRVELDEQIAKTFKTTGAVSEAEGDACHAASGAHLRELLRGNHRYVFTLVHKFQTPELLCDRSDVIVLTDEAHRSQYDTLALNMRAALPRAMFLAFTGTPLIAGEERTKEVFGDYVSIYDFQQSIEDGATVPLFYESLAEIEATAAGSMERLSRIDDAVNALISPDPLRRDFFAHERLVNTLYRAVKPDPSALEFASRVACLTTLAEAIRAKLNPNPPDISQVMGQINGLLDKSITGHEIREQGPPALDLSKINFEALASKFKASRHKNTDLEVLKAAIRAQLEKMIQLNRTRADFAEKFEALIESYNAGSRSIEQLFEELVKLSNSLNDEQERHVRENMSEEELVIFDILTRPAPELSAEERAEVKKAARELLARLKSLLVLNWRQKSTARSQLKLAIEDTLDTGLPRAYTPELYNQKCSAVFEHVYECYPERNAGVYALEL